ncbi:MAG: DUF11 domain-containing protein, partial [Desulfuromonadales bacterium]|nr:DUF11 domain-containing protein [Desulfuromonadales bacterium]
AGGVAPGTTVHIRATVSDPFGSYDINAARITLTDPLGAIQVNNQPMAPYADSLAATKTFEYIYDLPAGAELGNWTIRVDSDEGTEGTISDYGLGTLSVTEPMPSLMILKSADKATVNPGEVITYTITTMNSGAGPATTVQVFDNLSPYVGLILDYDGVTPPYEPFDFVPGTSGLTFGTPVYYNSDGIFNPNFAAGEDDTVIRWETPMTGSFNPGSQFTLRFKVRVK